MIFGLSIFLILIILFVGNLTNKSNLENNDHYFLNNRKTGFWGLVATLVMTEFNTSTLVAFSGLGVLGYWSLWMPFLFLIGLGFYTLSVAKKWNQLGGTSVAELFTEKYGEGIGKWASISLIIAMIGFSSTYVKSSALFLSGLYPFLPLEFSQLIVIAIVLGFSLRGGLSSIIKTDLLGLLLILILFPTLLGYAWIHWGKTNLLGWISITSESASHVLPIEYIISLLILVMFTYIASPWYAQKIFSAESSEVAFRAVALSSILVFVLYSIPIILVGWYTHGTLKYPDLDSQLPHLIADELPPLLQIFSYVVLFLAGGTTLSGIWSAQASMIQKDFYQNNISNSKAKILVILFAVFAWMGAVLSPETVLNQMILANIPIFALSFALLAGFYWNQVHRFGAFLSILGGNAWGVFAYLYFGNDGMYTWYWTVYGLPIVFGLGYLGSLIGSRLDPSRS
jgi:SSS family solute:Na+ symporter